MYRQNRSWMYQKHRDNYGIRSEFLNGVEDFIKFAQEQKNYMDGDKIRCPCTKCKNLQFKDVDQVVWDLYEKGFVANYYNWTSHGEPFDPSLLPQTVGSSRNVPTEMSGWGDYDQMTWDQRMAYDVYGASTMQFNPPQPFNDLPEASTSYQPDADEDQTFYQSVADEYPNSHVPHIEDLAERFQDVLKAADQPLYADCEGYSQLSAVTELMNIKSEYNLPESCMSRLLQSFGGMLPRDHNLPDSYYKMKQLMSQLGPPCIEIDACPEGCMLFWKDDVALETCKFCGGERYKPVPHRRKKPRKRSALSKLFYLPLAPRLQRMYASNATAKHMTWHVEHETKEGLMSHPSDCEAWRHFDRCHPQFAMEPRNVRLGLCSDGFAAFGKFGKKFSCWPVMLTPYNLPPDMCMKSHFIFLTLICPGPSDPKKRIDIYLQPLIEEMKELWAIGTPTYDVSRDQMFIMKAVIIWTISDFPAYGMLSGWSTHGLMGCPICMDQSEANWLKFSGKPSYFDCHRKFLPMNHRYRKDKKSFIAGRVVRDPPPPRLTGEQVFNRVRRFPTAVQQPHGEPNGYCDTHKWTKRSIFWELPYWKDLLIRNNLDVMHVEKNVFDNIFNTVMDFTHKTKDGLASRKDMTIWCDRPELAVDLEYVGKKIPRAVYQLTAPQRESILEWLVSLNFPDGYCSNLSRCVDLDKQTMTSSMKTHDAHVIMQRLLPIALKEMLPADVWGCITEISQLFQSICSAVLDAESLRRLEDTVPILMCNLEKILPPSFFDVMEHLLIHLLSLDVHI
ncbi:unnamed protein product [Cuscuta europaea]|uniref:Transposase-associated domain-containing protein n=1 Tax=Cuscuta europaea TaxID=41803 RepID=A0A9P0ZG39_CUSEU|nr:unnamed protein product [Cuscuta europaea]